MQINDMVINYNNNNNNIAKWMARENVMDIFWK